MKQVNIRELKANLSKYLRDLPVEITNHGVPVAWLIEPEVEPEYDFSKGVRGRIVPEGTKTVIVLDTETEPKAKINFESQNKTESADCKPGVKAEQFIDTAIEEKKKLPFNGGPCFHKALPGMCRIDWCPNYGGKK